MLLWHKILGIWMIYVPLSQNIVVKIYALFPQMFWDWKADSANFFTFRMYGCAKRLWDMLRFLFRERLGRKIDRLSTAECQLHACLSTLCITHITQISWELNFWHLEHPEKGILELLLMERRDKLWPNNLIADQSGQGNGILLSRKNWRDCTNSVVTI